jgi:periplasmic divalent cation tolerance protein
VRTLQVQFAIDDATLGEAIVDELLNRRVIACAQTIGPVTSRYWWHGTIEQAQEWLFVCKTTGDRLDEVIDAVRARHPYEVPEIVAFDIGGGFHAYTEWIAAETASPPGRAPA